MTSVTASYLFSSVEVVAWSLYVGGAIVMELVWRPAQRDLPGAQTAVACAVMGRRYRWIALGSLGAAGLAGVARIAWDPSGEPLSPATAYGRTLVALVVTWAVLVALVGITAFAAHPALHVRLPSGADAREREERRARVGRAIRRMDRILRVELAGALLAALLGALLSVGGA